jgi:hypothetical protein
MHFSLFCRYVYSLMLNHMFRFKWAIIRSTDIVLGLSHVFVASSGYVQKVFDFVDKMVDKIQ